VVTRGEEGRGLGETGEGMKECTCRDEQWVMYGSLGHYIVYLKLILHCMLTILEFKERQKIKKKINSLTNYFLL